MEEFLHFFETMPNWHKLLWIFICLSFSFILEAFIPLFRMKYQKLKHFGINMIFLSTTLIINFLFGLATLKLFNWMAINEFGLLYLVELPLWVEFFLAILLLDFLAQYLVHFLEHKVKFMWRFHMVHHSDTHVDATTGTRHHPGNYVFREIFALVAILIAGAPLAFYLAYKIFTIFFTYMTHANYRLPNWLDHAIGFVFISPNMHKFHHHFERPWTDTNFGNIFSIWDRIFGTFQNGDPTKIVYGLDVLDNSRDEDLGYQFGIPFNYEIKTDE